MRWSGKTPRRTQIFGDVPGIWQEFSFVWDATGFGWSIEGIPAFEVDMAMRFDKKLHLIINLAVGGAFPGMEPEPGYSFVGPPFSRSRHRPSIPRVREPD